MPWGHFTADQVADLLVGTDSDVPAIWQPGRWPTASARYIYSWWHNCWKMMTMDVIFIWMLRRWHVRWHGGDEVVSESHVAEVLKEGTNGSEDMSSEIIYCVWYFLRLFWEFRKFIFFPVTPQLSWNDLKFSLHLTNKTKSISWLNTLS